MIATLALMLVVAGAVEDDSRFKEARRMFQGFELEGALARFELVLLDNKLQGEERARVLLWKGLTEAELGRFSDAGATFEDALTLDKSAVLPVEASPKVIEMLDEARARVAKNTTAEGSADGALEGGSRTGDVATRADGTVHPVGPGVLIKTTEAGRMDAAVQEHPPPAAVADDEPMPWLLLAGTTTAGMGVLTLAAGGLLGALALADHTRAVDAAGARDASLAEGQAQTEALVANVLYGVGGAIVLAGIAVATTSLFLGDE